ncbi:MAG: beta-hydroxyacyl-(acyl-carrier-protein) dehydratase FabA/FabZ [Proteobacteria bacterium]|nr:beta-hydroxyacyl-(acyl-carrier-protein) dehydratase FabA/FabZ [Pseudomonadota bacterium]
MKPPSPPITEILPHRGTMLFIDTVSQYSSTAATCTYQPQADAWYANEEGNMPAWMGIEIMAQAIAAHVCMDSIARGEVPKMGALLGTRSYQSSVVAFVAGTPLSIEALLEFRDDNGLGAYECCIEADGRKIANATLKVFEPKDFDQFIAAGKTAS